jgi:hypothetical protein
VTTHSPELLAGSEARSVQIADQAQTVQVDSSYLLLLSRLGCLSCLNENPSQFYDSFGAAVRNELSSSLSSGMPLRWLGMWWKYSSFKKSINEDVDDFTRDVLLSQQMLSNTSLRALFREDARWTLLQNRAQETILGKLSVLRGDEDLDTKLEQIFVQQRDTLAKEAVFKFLPTVVLLLSTLIALVMAVLVWRSLTVGH